MLSIKRLGSVGEKLQMSHPVHISFKSNCANKEPYRRSFPSQEVYYRQSCPVYLVKNCADNVESAYRLTQTFMHMARERTGMLLGGKML
jgi:hypothetical protein